MPFPLLYLRFTIYDLKNSADCGRTWSMDKHDMYRRTEQFSLLVVRLVDSLPKTTTGRVFGSQVLRSATSIGANFREACKGKSPADFLSKIKICESEAEETSYWLGLIVSAGLVSRKKLALLMDESQQLCAIFSAMVKTAKRHQNTHA